RSPGKVVAQHLLVISTGPRARKLATPCAAGGPPMPLWLFRGLFRRRLNKGADVERPDLARAARCQKGALRRGGLSGLEFPPLAILAAGSLSGFPCKTGISNTDGCACPLDGGFNFKPVAAQHLVGSLVWSSGPLLGARQP